MLRSNVYIERADTKLIFALNICHNWSNNKLQMQDKINAYREELSRKDKLIGQLTM